MRRFPIQISETPRGETAEDEKEKRNGKGERLVTKFKCIYYVTSTCNSVDLPHGLKGREIEITKLTIYFIMIVQCIISLLLLF